MRAGFVMIFILFSGICSAQLLLSKPLSIQKQSGTTAELLKALVQQANVSISYSSQVVDLDRKVVLTGSEKTVEEVLKSILKGQPVKYMEQEGKIFLLALEPVKKKFTISGYVIDKETGERLIGASLFLPQKKVGTTTNVYGFFSITLEDDPSLTLQVSYTGFTTVNLQVSLQRDEELNIHLQQHIVANEPVVVNTEGSETTNKPIGKTSISSSFIRSMPSLLGEPDVLKSLKFLAGVQGGNEGTSGLNVRGGSADQNLILIDGVPVYNASHAFGLFSIFNGDAVHKVDFLKSGFPASYGGRLSSVVDVRIKEGDKNKFRGEGGIGFIFSKLTLEGPLQKGKSSFLISGRRTYLDLFLRPILKLSEGTTDVFPFFSDLNVKANFPLKDRDRFYFSFYHGKDKMNVTYNYSDRFDSSISYGTNSSGLSWGNITLMSRWNHVFNGKTFSNFTFTHSRYRFDTEVNETNNFVGQSFTHLSKRKYFSGIKDWSLKGDIDYLPAPDHFIKTGFAITLHHFQPGISSFYQQDSVIRLNTNIDKSTSFSTEYDFYLEDDIQVSDKMKVNVGTRFSAFKVKEKIFPSIQPRVSWLYKINKEWNVKASYSKMNQFIHLLTNSAIGLPTDLWLPVTERVPPQSAQQISAGAFYKREKGLETSFEVYYKSMKNVIDYAEGYGFGSVYDQWEDIVESGRGKTYGAELLLQKRKGPLTGLITYTWSRSIRQFANINEGKEFPFKYDRRHEVKTAFTYQPSRKVEFSAAWLLSSGHAISLPVSYYYNPVTRSYIDIYTGRNTFRMPDYHRLDLAVKFSKQKKKHLRTWMFSIYNAYNNFNPFFRYQQISSGKIEYIDVAAFPFLPSFSYQFKF